jgi:hypothetical protein
VNKLVATGLALALFGAASTAQARGAETAALGWVRLAGAESCPSAQQLAKDVEARIGRSVFVSPSVAELLIEAHVEHDASGFRAKVLTTRPDGRVLGTRELTSAAPDCADLAEQLTLVIALTIDPDAELRPKNSPAPAPAPSPPAAKPEPCPEPRIEVVEKEKRVVVSVPRERESWRGDARLAGTLTLALLPGVTPGLMAAGALKPPGFSPIELRGSAWPERRADVANGGATFTLLLATLAVCPETPLSDAIRAHFCGGIGLGSMRARGFGFDATKQQAEPVMLATGELRLSLHFTKTLFADLGVGLIGAVVRPRFFYTDAAGNEQDVYRVSPVGANAEIGFGFGFGS